MSNFHCHILNILKSDGASITDASCGAGVVHLGQIQSGLRAAIRIVQGSHIKIHMNSEVPVQVQSVEKKRITEKVEPSPG